LVAAFSTYAAVDMGGGAATDAGSAAASPTGGIALTYMRHRAMLEHGVTAASQRTPLLR